MKISVPTSILALLALGSSWTASAAVLRSGLASATLAVQGSEPIAWKDASGFNVYHIVGIVLLCGLFWCCIVPFICCFCIPKLVTKAIDKALDKAAEESAIKTAKELRSKFINDCPVLEKSNYCKDEFKGKCDALFDEADIDHNGKLDLNELREPVKKFREDGIDMDGPMNTVSLMMRAFDDNKDSSLDRDEFFEMMKYLEWSKVQQEKEEKEKWDRKLSFEKFFPELLTKSGKKTGGEVLQGKRAVLLYFSAHWCPPCRGFTPVFAKAYSQYEAADVEVVFISSDRDEASFNEYFNEMPWTALPFRERGIKDKLSKEFRVSGIPSVVVLNGDGSLLKESGRNELQSGDLAKALKTWGV